MYLFGICEKSAGAAALLRGARLDGVSWRKLGAGGRIGGMDAVAVMPGIPEPACFSSPLVVAPADTQAATAQLITYGMGARETLTYSSISPDGCVLSLQREIVTLRGLRLERQDIPLGCAPGVFGEVLLALAGALLAAGMPPAALNAYFSGRFPQEDAWPQSSQP
ncbi:MAG: hypothetical protein LBR85_08395 [Oscillospiraceae bacterium]|jgi:hypothetical protein|nr:hypothetical protein [Oscillospiraceae bacterium]